MPSKQQIRQAMRHERRALPSRVQRHAAGELAKRVSREGFFLRSRRLAFYLAEDGEIDPQPLRLIAEAAGKAIHLPVLHPLRHNRLLFARHRWSEPLIANRYGIGEPPIDRNPLAPTWSLDILFMPLVAFDAQGNRLGMGGGFYDRTLASLPRGHGFRPLLVGLAHHFQQVEALPAESWDIPLDAIATDRGLIPLAPRLRLTSSRNL